jgi:ATP-binding cassette subfamily B multidrug efflux pump
MSNTLLRLLAYCRPHLRLIGIGLLFLFLSSLAEVSGPLLIKYFIDTSLATGHWIAHEIGLFIITYLSLQGLAAFSSYKQALLFSKAAQFIVKGLRQETFAAALRLPARYLDNHQTGHLIATISNDTETLLQLYIQVIGQSIHKIVLLIGILGGMFWLNWQLASLIVVMIIMAIAVMQLYQRCSMPWSRQTRQLTADLNHQLSETLQGIPIIQSLVQEIHFADKFAQTNQQQLTTRKKVLKLNGLLLRPMIDLLYIFTLGGLLSWFALQGTSQIAVGVIYAFVSYMGRMIEPLNDLTNQLTQIQQSLIAGERIFSLLDEQKEPSGKYQQAIEGNIRFQHIHFRYQQDGALILQDINLALHKGKMMALVGHTGSGKSTILHLLSGMYPPTSGSIHIEKRSIAEWDISNLRSQLGIIQQDPFIFVGSVADNIRFGRCNISDDDIIQTLQHVQWFESLGKNETILMQLQEGGKNISAGQRQLLSFARALVTRPPIMILDEATANVDSQTEHHIQQAIAAIRQQHAWLIVAHRLSTIVDADEILVLQHGKIIERGNHSDLLAANKHYATLYQLQQLTVS